MVLNVMIKAVLLDRNVWSFVGTAEEKLPADATYSDKQKYKKQERKTLSSIYLNDSLFF